MVANYCYLEKDHDKVLKLDTNKWSFCEVSISLFQAS